MVVEDGLIDLISLRRETYGLGILQVENRFRLQCSVVMDDLKVLREEVLYVIRGAESHRWRKWLLGGFMAALIPAIRAIWRRPRDDKGSSNDTEYAYQKSKSLVNRILDLRHGFGRLASFTFFVFAAVYVFQNEVTLRVAKTVSKRLRRLSAKLERGDSEITEEDLRLVRGWRWRVLA
ncbi:hypothetical protein M406DRAFT_321415 [Cryphonectria parasitica EP155]|uniref:Uncharacterized protein n=1 Tax=Cryphonectria parasitica (strain ATCC 38755 / EP155) TaxID=660469 RepID=A0A9P4Y5J4_CRYP1|nr:uncharacterized protein M406DRAFT_321415 [Cryphonectria parasitica EP155]KAF3766943.1 hypothetical protein M406DRAFT_321415 [Cryphonectria parasitica EP155]